MPGAGGGKVAAIHRAQLAKAKADLAVIAEVLDLSRLHVPLHGEGCPMTNMVYRERTGCVCTRDTLRDRAEGAAGKTPEELTTAERVGLLVVEVVGLRRRVEDLEFEA